MPIFEYRCGTCGKKYEELIFGDRDRKVPCPACGSEKTEKLMSAIGAISTGPADACGASCANAPACAAAGGACGSGCPHAA